MRRTIGSAPQVKGRDDWDENENFEKSREEEASYQNRLRKTPLSTALGEGPRSGANQSVSRKSQSSGIPRSGMSTPSRIPSALKTSRNRSYSSSSSASSRTTTEEVPPLPRNSIAPRQVYTENTPEDDSFKPVLYKDTKDPSLPRPQSGLPRRSSSIARPSSRSRSRNDHSKPEYPPPETSSYSDTDGIRDFKDLSTIARDHDKTPNPMSWAKDRRRFAGSGVSSTYVQPHISQPGSTSTVPKKVDRSSSEDSTRSNTFISKPPIDHANALTSHGLTPSRMLSNATRASWARETSKHPEIESESRSSAQPTSRLKKESFDSGSRSQLPRPYPASSRRYSTSHPRAVESSGAPRTKTESNEPSRSSSLRVQQEHSVTNPTYKRESLGSNANPDVVRISSTEDMPLPTPPLPQADFNKRNRTPGGGPKTQPDTISSPLKTMLMGSNSGSVQASTPVRPERESSVYPSTAAPSTPAMPGGRRFSEPSPGNQGGTPRVSSKENVKNEQGAAPTILQRLARRASFSAGKSPKARDSTPKSSKEPAMPNSPAEVEHDETESPFELDIVTPRATIGSVTALGLGRPGSEKGATYQDSTRLQLDRQKAPVQTTVGTTVTVTKKPRSLAVDGGAGTQGDIGKLGSPFMGDGSPRFGIDERFRSPMTLSKSGLRNAISNKSHEEDTQELFGYYTSDETAAGVEGYPTTDTPIATVLSSPRDAVRRDRRKPWTPSSSTARDERRSQKATAYADTQPCRDTSAERPEERRPRVRTPSRVTFSPHPPDVIRLHAHSSSESSVSSRFSDSPRGGDTVASNSGGPSSGIEVDEVSQSCSRTHMAQSGKANTAETHSSRLPIPKKRNTNSALFRALEQPYANSPFSSNTPTDASSNSLCISNNDEPDYREHDSLEQLHTVSSNLSSLNGDKVGDIRWSDTYELSSATDVLLQNINGSSSTINRPQVVIQAPSDAYTTDDMDDDLAGSAYSDDLEFDTNSRPDSPQSPIQQSDTPTAAKHDRRMSTQDKRKAIHESWRASLESEGPGNSDGVHDAMEYQRQQTLRKLHESEETYVELLRIVLHHFVRPLRTQHQRQWISGLDPGVMRLFDWLDDIANLHDQILSALDSLRQNTQSALIGFSDTIRPFVPMMEIYQPYVIRVEEVSKNINAMSLDPDSNFGEFVRMQSALPECYEVSLEEMLSRPVKRLQEYVETFERILALTPRGHSDYLSTFSLFHSMHALRSVLFEVKVQEEEYDLTKSLLSRVRGLPSGIMVPSRERRILVQGILRRVYPPEDFTGARGTRIVDSLTSSTAAGRLRSGSESTTRSSITGSSTSSTARLAYSSTEYTMRSGSSATCSIDNSLDDRKASRTSFLPHAGSRPRRASRSRSRSHADPELSQLPRFDSVDTYVLVFTDLVILANPIVGASRPTKVTTRPTPSVSWDALDLVGVFRLFGTTEHPGQYGSEDLVSLDLLSLGHHEETGKSLEPPVFFDIEDLNDEASIHPGTPHPRREWLASFQKCYLHTLRSVSFPCGPEGFATSNSHVNSHRTSQIGMSGGLALPTSPSQQRTREGRLRQHGLPPVGHVDEEREERDFWTERFRTVFEDARKTYIGPCPSADLANSRVAPKQPMTKTCRSSGIMI
ncbi:RhoGEF domain protein [Ceratobasidium sp. AG-Ba]|nr:RhoGEF domain protein [Ceratobasidium sp. AG-Ba]